MEMSNGDFSVPATKGDIVRIHEKVDRIEVSLATVATKMDGMKQIEQPCEAFKGHIKEHREIDMEWKKNIIRNIIKIVAAMLVGAAGVNLLPGKDKPVSEPCSDQTSVKDTQ